MRLSEARSSKKPRGEKPRLGERQPEMGSTLAIKTFHKINGNFAEGYFFATRGVHIKAKVRSPRPRQRLTIAQQR
jgi:hypothetical protein